MSNNCVNNTRHKSTISRLGIVGLFGLVGLIVVLGFLGSGTVLAEEPSRLVLPFSIGETWCVCQGYDTGTHTGTIKFGLDLSIDSASASPGSTGCTGDKNASTDRLVLAPASGKIVLHERDGMCINLDSGNSMWIGHLSNRASLGPIKRDDRIGTVAPPGSYNGNYAHIHVQIHPGLGCAPSGQSIPFDDAHGTRFEGGPDLPDSGGTSQHRGTKLTRKYEDDAQFVAQSAYLTVQRGQKFQIYFEVKNTGFGTWRRDENYYLANINNTPLGANPRQEVDSDVPPEAIKRWTISMLAPSTLDVYRTQWMVKHGDESFGPNMFIDVTVVTKPEDGWRRVIERIRQAWERLIEDLRRKLEETMEDWQRRMEQEMDKAIQRFLENLERELERAIQETCAGPAALLVGTCALAFAKSRQSGRKR